MERGHLGCGYAIRAPAVPSAPSLFTVLPSAFLPCAIAGVVARARCRVRGGRPGDRE
ncbi:hypothetical protein FRAAL0251 [Frankia alni ACN14a]|uniref:Uncharacterized protein n=1 Tax=Frankia alni (strain DSM 45986 / CECT 9034 / ACN14a) TaxID=326424 RepID=Q0RU16_FRAAA|nr:hypothetical protein FRAAL0251 [Frankia alni ACN14a]